MVFAHVLPWVVFVQGIVLSGVSLSRWRHHSNRYLGMFFLLLSLHALVGLAWVTPPDGSAAVLFVLLSSAPFLYGPLLFRYVWHSLMGRTPEGVPMLVHAIPALANVLFYAAVYAVVGRVSFTSVASGVFSGRAPIFVVTIEWAKLVSGLCYTVRIVRLLNRHWGALKRWASYRDRKRWLVALVASFAVNWIIVLFGIASLWGGFLSSLDTVTVTTVQLVGFLVFVYIATFFAIRYPVVLDPQEAREAIRRKLNLPPEFIEETRRRLRKMEEAGEYTDPDLTLDSLAKKIGLHPNALSFIVNEEMGTGFRQYLNNLRLDEFLRRAENRDRGDSLLNIAFEAGFSSKTTFLRVFRARFGTTPMNYVSQSRHSSELRDTRVPHKKSTS